MWIMCIDQHYKKSIGAQIDAQNNEDFGAQTGSKTMLGIRCGFGHNIATDYKENINTDVAMCGDQLEDRVW